MKHRVEARFSDAMWDAACHMARADRRNTSRDPGVSSLIQKAMRQLLSQNHYPVAVLDMDDDEYAQYVKTQGKVVPRARKGKKSTLGEDG